MTGYVAPAIATSFVCGTS